jgi:hypothetical protein
MALTKITGGDGIKDSSIKEADLVLVQQAVGRTRSFGRMALQ